jgi:hypothetical protein
MRNHRFNASIVFVFVFAAFAASQARAQDAAALWQQLVQPLFDSERAASAENVTLVRDRLRITLATGTIQFSKPAQDVVFGAAFRGKGRIEVKPPNPIEAHHLRMSIGQDSIGMDFSEATFTFTDGAYEEISKQVHWKTAADNALGELYLHRQEEREDSGAEIVPRLFQSILSANRKRTALFAADLKTSDKGWIHLRFDALEPEEIAVGRWAEAVPGIVLDSWLSFPAGDRAAALAYADPFALEDFEIQKYRIDAKITAGAELSAVTRVSVSLKTAGERVMIFKLDSNLRVDSIKDQDGKSLAFFQPRDPKDRPRSYGDYVAVVLPAPGSAGSTMTLEFNYAGKRVVRSVGAGSYFCQSYGWYPARDTSFAGRADFDMTFRCPKRYTFVATGNKISESVEGDWKVSIWKSSPALAVAGFAFGDFKQDSQKVGNITVEAYANVELDDSMKSLQAAARSAPVAIGSLSPAAHLKTMGDELGNTVRLFESYFGPYPYERLAVTNIPYSYGQGWPTLIYLSFLSFLDSTQRNALGITKNIQLTDFFRAHESSHQWWGHKIGWKSYHDQWLSEGLAQFSGNLYVQYRQNEKEYLNQLKQNKEQLLTRDRKSRVYESVGPIWMGTRLSSSEAPDDYSVIVYNKGGLVVNALRRMLWNSQSKNGDDRFIAMLKDYCETYNNKAASTEDFKAVVEKHMIPALDLEGNRRMDWFFRQYVYGTGIPEYRIQWQADDAGSGQYKIKGKILQAAVPAGWLDAMPLYMQSGGKTFRIGLIGVKGQETAFEFTLPLKPDKLILNYLEDTLAVIK